MRAEACGDLLLNAVKGTGHSVRSLIIPLSEKYVKAVLLRFSFIEKSRKQALRNKK